MRSFLRALLRTIGRYFLVAALLSMLYCVLASMLWFDSPALFLFGFVGAMIVVTLDHRA